MLLRNYVSRYGLGFMKGGELDDRKMEINAETEIKRKTKRFKKVKIYTMRR